MSSTDLPHDQIEELIAADALDGLDPADRDRLTRLMAEHGPDCVECGRLTAEYREAAAAMALIADPVPMSTGAEEALIRAARASQEPQAETFAGPPGAGGQVRRWIASAAVAAALAVIAGVIGYSIAPNPAPLRTLAFKGTAPGQLSLVYQPGHEDAVLVGAGLSDPGPGRVYELWYQPAPGARMVPGGVFTPTDGSVRQQVTVGRSFVVVAVTAEPAPGGSQQPTSEPILSASA